MLTLEEAIEWEKQVGDILLQLFPKDIAVYCIQPYLVDNDFHKAVMKKCHHQIANDPRLHYRCGTDFLWFVRLRKLEIKHFRRCHYDGLAAKLQMKIRERQAQTKLNLEVSHILERVGRERAQQRDNVR